MNSMLKGAALAVAAVTAVAMPAAAKTLVYCSEGSPENFDPQLNTTGTSFDAARPVYNQLVEFQQGTTTVVPGLAQSWTSGDNGTVFTFKLRKGVKWHSNANFKPTRDFNADDVLYSFNRQWKEDNPYHKLNPQLFGYFGDMSMPTILKSIEKIDDYTVKFTLNQPEAPFLADLAMDFASILSAEYGDAMLKANTPEKVAQEPIGTGPFQFVTYQKDAQIRFKAFPAYWGGAPKIDLVYSITPDASVRVAKLKAGECHVSPFPPPADIAALKADKNLQVLQQPGLNIGYVIMNVTKKPFDDKRVRQAMNMAVDKAAILKTVYQGAGEEAINPMPPTEWSYNKAIKAYPHDPAKAKALLAEAGYPNGFETDLWALPVQRPYNPDGKKIAELIQADLAKLGIKATIKTYEWGEYRKRLSQGEAMFGQIGWTGDNGDPDNFLNPLLSCDAARPGGGNSAKWCNKEFDALLVKAKTTAEVPARTKLYEQAQQLFHEEVPWVTLAHSVVTQPMRKEVVGYKMSPFGRHEFAKVELK